MSAPMAGENGASSAARPGIVGATRVVVGVAEAAVSSDVRAVIVTHALGSCLGLAVHDPAARVGGIFHPMLPSASVSPDSAARNPFLCVDSGFRPFLERLIGAGARKNRLVVKVAGGGRMYVSTQPDIFDIGRRNFTALRKILWNEGMMIHAECVGGTRPQTVFLHIASGRTQVATGHEVNDL